MLQFVLLLSCSFLMLGMGWMKSKHEHKPVLLFLFGLVMLALTFTN